MKSYHKEKDGQAFAKKHGYKVKNYVKTPSGTRMDIHKEMVDPMDLRGRPKKRDPYPKSPYGLKHPLHPVNIAKKKAKETEKNKKESVDEAIKNLSSADQVKAAIKIIRDKRFNMRSQIDKKTAIQKISKDLLKDPKVKKEMDKIYEESVDEARVTSIAFRKKNAMVNPMDRKNISDMAKDKKYKGNTSALIRDVKKKYPDQHHSKTVQDIYKRHAETNEATVKEISKSKARRYIGYAARDVFNLGKRDQAASDIGRLGGKHPDQDYQKGPERKAAKRVGGIDRATKILMKKDRKEATTSDAERKAIDDFIKKGKMKKLKPGYAQGYHGKSDPAAGMKGMMDKGDTKAFGTRKKVGSMK